MTRQTVDRVYNTDVYSAPCSSNTIWHDRVRVVSTRVGIICMPLCHWSMSTQTNDIAFTTFYYNIRSGSAERFDLGSTNGKCRLKNKVQLHGGHLYKFGVVSDLSLTFGPACHILRIINTRVYRRVNLYIVRYSAAS